MSKITYNTTSIIVSPSFSHNVETNPYGRRQPCARPTFIGSNSPKMNLYYMSYKKIIS